MEIYQDPPKRKVSFLIDYIDPEDEKYDPPTTVDFKVQKINKNKRVVLKNGEL